MLCVSLPAAESLAAEYEPETSLPAHKPRVAIRHFRGGSIVV